MESSDVRVVWITMLAMADAQGRVWASLPGLAKRSNVPMASAEQAITCFLSPDPHSRTEDFEGRRIEKIDGGWRLLNYAKFRAMKDSEATLESKRRYINNRRAAERAAKAAAESPPPPVKPPAPKKPGAKPATPTCPHEEIIDAYHRILTMCPKIRVWPDVARKHLQARWAEDDLRQDVAWWEQTFEYIKADCPFLIGAKADFRASLMWLVNPTNFAKVLNGNYEVEANGK